MEGQCPGVDPRACLEVAQGLIPDLVENTYSTKVFASKWQAIRTKLEDLGRGISDVADCSQWSENPLMRDLLPDVVSTLRHVGELAKSCTVLKYSGKLLMQSDLDVVVSRLNLHLRDIDLLIKSGVLEGSGSNADRVFLVRDLFSRLLIGNMEHKQKALNSLVEVLGKDEEIVSVVAEEGDIGYLVHLLDSNVVGIRELVVVAVSILAKVCEANLFGDEGVVAPLIRLLESGSYMAKEKAAEALRALTSNSENAWAVCANGGIATLLRFCEHGPPELREASVGILLNLCSVEEVRGCVAEEGGVTGLIDLMNSGTAPVQESAVKCLNLLACDVEKARQAIESKKGVEALVMFLERAETDQAQEIAFRAIHGLSASRSASMLLVHCPQFLKQLVSVLCGGQSTIQNLAASVVCDVAQGEKTAQILGEAGCIRPLARMLDGKQNCSQEIAARALSKLFLWRNNRIEFIKDDDGVACLVRLLDPGIETVNKKFPLWAIDVLCESKSCRKKVVLAGACEHLRSLIEMEVVGAKKVLHKLAGGSTLLKVLSGKWRGTFGDQHSLKEVGKRKEDK